MHHIPSQNEQSLTHPKYRPDIDGLRAIAVLSVVAYHAFPEYLSGGFIGVDIFFVISGYLISSIIFKSIDHGQFSFRDFYARRIRRIFPSLILVLVFSFTLGWHTLFVSEMEQLGRHILGGTLFAANFVLWQESGYFDNIAELKPLLHLWSLSIEEQFYIFFPLLAYFFYKRRSIWLPMLLGITILSFVLGLFALESQPVAAFYAPWNRFWEILLGSLLAYQKHRWRPSADQRSKHFSQILSWVGMSCLLAGLIMVDKNKAFPGWYALLPCGGALCLIAAGQQAWLNRRLLSLSPLVWVGLISYPLYLWHWPLLSFARILQGGPPSLELRLVLVLLSFLFAWLTYQWVESYLRTSSASPMKIFGLSSALVMLAILGAVTQERRGFHERRLIQVNPFANMSTEHAVEYQESGCGIEDPQKAAMIAHCVHDKRNPAKVAIIGDSKAKSLVAGLIKTSDESTRVMLVGGAGPKGAPLPVWSTHPIYEKFRPLTTIAVDALRSHPSIEVVVLVAAMRNLYALNTTRDIQGLPSSPYGSVAEDGLIQMVELLRAAGKKVVLLVDNPTLPDPRDCITRLTPVEFINKTLGLHEKTCTISLDEHRRLTKNYIEMLHRIGRQFPKDVRIVDATEELCDMQSRECRSTLDGDLLYIQTDHVSDKGAERIARRLMPVAKELLEQL